MDHIDYKFKDCSPTDTVENINGILKTIGVDAFEKWYDSGLENCFTVALSPQKGFPRSVGKGVTKEFARASAYAEFIERIQAGLHVMGYQSLLKQPKIDIHLYAPDGKYMTIAELIENGEWMDHIIQSYQDPKITREAIANLCSIYAGAEDGKILTLPFYSLFEKKYVYLPSAFVSGMYTANGNCAGNTREEAWVHALSEMMERNASQKLLVSGASVPRIPEETLNKFPTVSNILRQIHQSGNYDVAVFDCSIGNGFPVVSTRIIHKDTQAYRINTAADPVLEIAVQRTLTETFQGLNVHDFHSSHSGRILNKITDFPISTNVVNQLRASNGLYTADYFADELTCTRQVTQFADNSNKTNKELLAYMLELYRELGKPVYVRNLSYLGFHSYKFVVPGFSETRWVKLGEPTLGYAMAAKASAVYRNPQKATDLELTYLLTHSEMIKGSAERYGSFSRLSGVPLSEASVPTLVWVSRAYASYRLKNYKSAIMYLKRAIGLTKDSDTKQYFSCINKYLELKTSGVDEEKIRVILYKFFVQKYADQLYVKLDRQETPYDDYLFCCDFSDCENCKYRDICSFCEVQSINEKAGLLYAGFAHGQDPDKFEI